MSFSEQYPLRIRLKFEREYEKVIEYICEWMDRKHVYRYDLEREVDETVQEQRQKATKLDVIGKTKEEKLAWHREYYRQYRIRRGIKLKEYKRRKMREYRARGATY